MFILLLIVTSALGGLIAVVMLGGISLDALPALPIAASVIGALILLYLATHFGGRGEGRFGRLPTMLGVLVVTVLAIGALRDNPHFALPSLLASSTSDDETSALVPNAPASVRVRRGDDGSFHANSEVNGEALPMLIDTGSATVVLRQSDAEKAGIETRALAYDTPLSTANGTNYLATVRLKSVRIGPLTIDDVEALVAKPGTLNESLLGQNFLRRLVSYEVAGDFATLRQ